MGKFGARTNEKDGASPGKIFIGGLPRDTTLEAFRKHFEKYGNIIDHVIMKDKYTSKPRGFGFITFEDPSAVDQVIEDTHVFNGKTVEIKRTIPKGSVQSKDFKTKKIFVGGIPSTLTEDEFERFFAKHGKVVDHQIIRDHSTNRSRGFGFIIFDSEQVVDDLLSKGNMIDLAGSQVEIKKAEPKKASSPPPSFVSEPRGRAFSDGLGGFGNSYSGFGGAGFDPSSYRTPGLGGRLSSGYGGYGVGASEFDGGYGGLGGGIGSYRGESSLGYSSRLGSYGGFGGGYGGGLGGYGRGEESFGNYGGSSFGGSYETGPGAGYGPGGLYGSRGGGYGGSGAGRYHPYGR